jgi:hypothetical protein
LAERKGDRAQAPGAAPPIAVIGQQLVHPAQYQRPITRNGSASEARSSTSDATALSAALLAGRHPARDADGQEG